MASIYNRGPRAKPNWWVGWIDRNGQHRAEKIGADRGLALQVKAKKEHDLVAKKFDIQTEPPPSVPLFGAAADAFIDRRKAPDADGKPMRRSWREDKGRIDKHLRPRFGRIHLDEIHEGDLRGLIDALRLKLKPQSIRNCLAIISRIYNTQPKALELQNPVAGLDRADRDSIGPGWDPRLTPYLKAEQVRAVCLALPEMARESPWRAMFAVGTFAGLRPGEVIALEWADLDFDARTIHVRRSDDGPLKDDESRIAPLPDTLAAVLTDWRKLAPVGVAQLFEATGRGGRRRKDGRTYVKQHTLRAVLKTALAAAKAPPMHWYQATRHSFASRYVQAGGSSRSLSRCSATT